MDWRSGTGEAWLRSIRWRDWPVGRVEKELRKGFWPRKAFRSQRFHKATITKIEIFSETVRVTKGIRVSAVGIAARHRRIHSC